MRKRRNFKRLTVSCSRAIKVSSKSKCVCNSSVICAEVFGRTIFPLGATGSDGFDESRGDIVNVDATLFTSFWNSASSDSFHLAVRSLDPTRCGIIIVDVR
jgi:hypothetical protein